MGKQKTIEEIIKELSPESQEKVLNHLNSLKATAIKGAITQVMVRNQSHNLGANVKEQVTKPPATKK